MRQLPETAVITCQLSLYPLGREDFQMPIVQVLDLIANSGLEHQVGEMSTFVRGPRAEIFALLEGISAALDAAGCAYALPLTLSNTCGID